MISAWLKNKQIGTVYKGNIKSINYGLYKKIKENKRKRKKTGDNKSYFAVNMFAKFYI